MPEQHLLRVAQDGKMTPLQFLRHLLLCLCFLNLPSAVVLLALMNIFGLSPFIFPHSCMGRSVINSSSSIVRPRFIVYRAAAVEGLWCACAPRSVCSA